MKTFVLPTLATLCATLFTTVAKAASDDTLLKAKPEAVEAWKDMRFGMFICWGPMTLTGKEIGWSRGAPTSVAEYDNLEKKRSKQ